MDMASERVDIRNLPRSLFAYMYCGTNDWYQGTAVLDRSQAESRWYWLTWDRDESFIDEWKTSKGALWEQDALAQVVTADSKTGYWRTTYYNFRSALFSRLMNNDARYRSYFLRTVTDALNHELTPAFFKERIDHYDSMLPACQDPVPSRDLRHYEASKEFVRNRGEFVRKSLQHRFAQSRVRLGDVYRVSFEGLGPQIGYMSDGYAEAGAYTGKYSKGQRIEISVPGGSERQRWVINGETIEGKILSLPVRSDLFISHVKT